MAVTKRLILLAAAFAATFSASQAAAAEGPAGTVQRLHDALLEVMRDAGDLSVADRYERLAPTLQATYDFRMMTRLATGSAWTKATEAERAAMVDGFSRLSIATYAERFKGYSGERFEIMGERSGPRETILVDTRIVRPADDAVPITYVLQQSPAQNGDWRIIDVVVQGSISELAVRRSEYAHILRQGGAKRLADVLDAKADTLLGR